MAFSVIIPTWNNLAYLQNCLRSIELHSAEKHQLLIVVNEGNDGTVQWLKDNDIQYIHHEKNVGICIGLNSATHLIQHDHLVYLNDDMYVLPNWDTELSKEIESLDHCSFILSGTMIEPTETGNNCVLVQNFGDDLASFKEKELLDYHKTAHKSDWTGSSWPPILIPTSLWKKVGGMSEEFSPGMYSDPDLSMKIWHEGVRYYKGVGSSRVYHYGSKSTRKLGKNVGRQTFLNKWNITANYFYQNYLKMGSPWKGLLPEHKISLVNRAIHQLKKIKG